MCHLSQIFLYTVIQYIHSDIATYLRYASHVCIRISLGARACDPRALQRPRHARSGTQELWSCAWSSSSCAKARPTAMVEGKCVPFRGMRPARGSTGLDLRALPSGIGKVRLKPGSHRKSSWTSTRSERKSELDRSGDGSGQQVAGALQS